MLMTQFCKLAVKINITNGKVQQRSVGGGLCVTMNIQNELSLQPDWCQIQQHSRTSRLIVYFQMRKHKVKLHTLEIPLCQ